MVKPKVNKTRFIVSFPFDKPAREVISAGKAKGIKFKEAYVYRVRNLAKSNGRTGAALAAKAPPDAVRPRADGSRERDFRALVVELGVGRSRGLIGEVEVALRRLLGI
jgi:hypothetical protein